MNQQVFLKIKEDYSQKSKDPFFSAFLDTQLLNVHIFKYWYLLKAMEELSYRTYNS